MRDLADAGDVMDWRDEAACRHHDPELFFPEGTAGPACGMASPSAFGEAPPGGERRGIRHAVA